MADKEDESDHITNLELGQDILRHQESLGEDLAVHIHRNVPVPEDRFVRDVQTAGPDSLGGELSVPVPDQVPRPVRHHDVDAARHRGLQLGRQDHRPELDGVARPVDGLVRLDEDRVSLVLVLQAGRLQEGDGRQAFRLKPVAAVVQLSDTETDQLGLARRNSGGFSDLN